MIRYCLPALLLFAITAPVSAQWSQAGLFSTVIHFQACAFHSLDSGLFVYGANNPGPNPVGTEGGLLLTDDGAASGGYYVWYEPSTNLEDIDLKMVDGKPLYMAAGHELYNRSIVVRPFAFPEYPIGFDSLRTGTGRYYRAIRMRNDLVAFTAGGDQFGNGIIDMSTDTGATWSNIAVLPGQPVSRLHFVNDQLGFAATGGYSRLNSNGVQVPDSGAIYRTVDGGLSWQQVFADANTGFSDVEFVSEDIGVATRNDGVFLRTVDGGDNWAPALNTFAGNYILSGITFRPDGMGFATAYRTDGTAAYILASEDEGASWYFNFGTGSLNSPRRLYDVYFSDDAHGYANGHIRPLRSNGLITSEEEMKAPGAGALFPNPADERTVLHVTQAGSMVQLFDGLGRCVWNGRAEGAGPFNIPLAHLASGHYTIRVVNEVGVESHTLIHR